MLLHGQQWLVAPLVRSFVPTSWLTLFILVAAAHRIWVTWLYQEISRPLREWMLRRGGRIAYLASCAFCVSVWCGVVTVALWLLCPLAVTALALGGLLMLFADLWQGVTSALAALAYRPLQQALDSDK